MYKIIFTDLDGTLLPHDKQMSSYTKEVIAKVRAGGVKVILASGRAIKAMQPFHAELALDEPLISYNGALIEQQGEECYYQPLPEAVARRLLDFALERNLYFHFYHKNQLRTISAFEGHGEFIEYSQRNGLTTEYVEVENIDLSSVTKWMFVDRDRKELEELASYIQRTLGQEAGMSFTSDIYFEVYHKEVNKGNAALKVMQMYGLSPQEAISFGDNYNDLEMISVAQFGVAIKGSAPDICAVATMVSEFDCDEDGVAKVLEELFLQEEK